jgi:hypothetical protein
MKTHLLVLVRALAALGVVLGLGACDQFKFKGHVTTVKTENGVTTVKRREVDKLEDMPGAISEAADEMAAVTAKLIKKLTDVPPPGKVKLGDLGAGFKDFEGQKEFDFVMQAKEGDKPIEFQYVQIGVPDYDKFFKTTAEIYALTYQTKQSLNRMRLLASAVLDEDISASASVSAAVDRALGSAQAEAKGDLTANLKQFKAIGQMLASVVPAIVDKVSTLVSLGQKLILGAPTAITNPKVVLHLGLIKEGLGDSVKVIQEAGKNLGGIVADLGNFGKKDA